MQDYGEFVPAAMAMSSDHNILDIRSKVDFVPVVVSMQYAGEEACVDMVLQGHHSHLEFFPYLQHLYSALGHEKAVYYFSERIYEADLVFYFRKGTPWKYKFDEGIQRLVESSLIDKWRGDIINEVRGNNTEGRKESAEQSLSVSHLQGPFLILVIGISLASSSFVIEILRGRFN